MTESKPIVLPSSFAPAGVAFWTWIYNDVFAHPTGPIRRFAHWPGAGIEAIENHGGLDYSWMVTGSVATLLLQTGDKAAKVARAAVTDSPRPPFSLLSRVWFDLAHGLGMVTDAEWEHLCAAADAMKPSECSEYGNSW